jgi:NADH-quinone oxidoreductase subunit J
MNGIGLRSVDVIVLSAVNLTLEHVLRCPTFWALLLGSLGLWLLLPTRAVGKLPGGVLLALAAGLLAYDLPLVGDWTDQLVFWLLAVVTLGAAVATISSQSPVYSAIWFALSLLGTAGLFLQSGAQFLGVATVVVYAGAIVVTFLFVIMLAQPEGHASYDRMAWGWLPKLLGVVTAAALVGILTFMLGDLKKEALQPRSPAALAAARANLRRPDGILAERHMANVGRRLFSEHLVSVELAGTLLLVALVGAVAIATYGRPRPRSTGRPAERIEEALE